MIFVRFLDAKFTTAKNSKSWFFRKNNFAIIYKTTCSIVFEIKLAPSKSAKSSKPAIAQPAEIPMELSVIQPSIIL